MNMFTGPDAEVLSIQRPRTRGECGEVRPCPWVSCRHHLLLDVHVVEGTRDRPPTIRFNGRSVRGLQTGADASEVQTFVDAAVERLDQLEHTCSLDVADEGRHLYREVAQVLSVRRQRVVEKARLAKAAMALAMLDAGLDRGATRG